MRTVERLARASDRLFDRLRDRRAFAVTDDTAIDGDFASIRGRQYALLVTFRANGEAVPSPVWPAVDDEGTVYVKTAPYAGKVKRLGNDDRVLLAPCNSRGKPTGPAVRGTGRVLARDRWAHAEEHLAAAHGFSRAAAERFLGRDDLTDYLEIRPGR